MECTKEIISMLERYISDFIASFEFEKDLLLYQSNDVFLVI